MILMVNTSAVLPFRITLSYSQRDFPSVEKGQVTLWRDRFKGQGYGLDPEQYLFYSTTCSCYKSLKTSGIYLCLPGFQPASDTDQSRRGCRNITVGIDPAPQASCPTLNSNEHMGHPHYSSYGITYPGVSLFLVSKLTQNKFGKIIAMWAKGEEMVKKRPLLKLDLVIPLVWEDEAEILHSVWQSRVNHIAVYTLGCVQHLGRTFLL